MSQTAEDKAIIDISKAIYASLSYTDEKLTAEMNLPSAAQTDNEMLALGLQSLLINLFRLNFPAAEMLSVSNGENVEFVEEGSVEDLPPRSISICLNSEYPKITIAGAEPQHGRDAFSELHFQWQKQAGSQDELGNTDLKELNSFPTVQEGELLATIRDRTFGSPGINSLGKIIKQRVGKLLLLNFDENNIEKRDDDTDKTKFYLYAKKSGIADFKTLLLDNPKTLNKLTITNTITINGDIDYSVGNLSDEDLGCGAINIVVKGDVRGAFSLKSKGYISVSGTVEGQKIIAKNIQINVITADSEAIAEKQVIIGTLIKAKARGQVVTLKRASNDSELVGTEQVKLEKGVNCLALKIRTRELISESNNFSGSTLVILGQELFDQEEKILAELEADNKTLTEGLGEISEAGESATFNFRQFKVFISQGFGTISSECREQLNDIQEELESTLNTKDHPLQPKLINKCYSLPNLLGDAEAVNAATAKVEPLTNSLQTLNMALHRRCKSLTRIEKNKALLEGLRDEVERLRVNIEDPKFVTNASEVRIQCGSQQITFSPDNPPDSALQITYELTSETGISDGTLVTEESF